MHMSTPVQGVLMETLPPHHGGYGSGHQVRVVLGPIANEVTESQLPCLYLQNKENGLRNNHDKSFCQMLSFNYHPYCSWITDMIWDFHSLDIVYVLFL